MYKPQKSHEFESHKNRMKFITKNKKNDVHFDGRMLKTQQKMMYDIDS